MITATCSPKTSKQKQGLSLVAATLFFKGALSVASNLRPKTSWQLIDFLERIPWIVNPTGWVYITVSFSRGPEASTQCYLKNMRLVIKLEKHLPPIGTGWKFPKNVIWVKPPSLGLWYRDQQKVRSSELTNFLQPFWKRATSNSAMFDTVGGFFTFLAIYLETKQKGCES